MELVHRALKIDPDCSDAYNVLGCEESDPYKKRECFKKAVDPIAPTFTSPGPSNSAVVSLWNFPDHAPIFSWLFSVRESCKTLEKLICFDSAKVLSHAGMVRFFRTALLPYCSV
jgi:hypothetical protein